MELLRLQRCCPDAPVSVAAMRELAVARWQQACWDCWILPMRSVCPSGSLAVLPTRQMAKSVRSRACGFDQTDCCPPAAQAAKELDRRMGCTPRCHPAAEWPDPAADWLDLAASWLAEEHCHCSTLRRRALSLRVHCVLCQVLNEPSAVVVTESGSDRWHPGSCRRRWNWTRRPCASASVA